MTSRERMLAALSGQTPDYVPCSFMLFYNLLTHCRTDAEFVEKQVELGLDACVHVGHLGSTMHLQGTPHPDVTFRQWVERRDGAVFFCRRIDTPKGPLTSRLRQNEGWPTEDDFPLLKDWVIPRSEEFLVKPEQDLEKLPYLLGEFRDADIRALRAEAAGMRTLADRHQLLQVGGWKGHVRPGLQVDPGVAGADTMSWLSGYVDVMTLSLTDPAIIREYARIIHEWALRQIRLYLEVTGAELIIRRAWYETTEFWTPAAYRTILAPFLKKEVDLVHQAGRKFGYIVTSAFEPLLDPMLDTGIDVLIGLDPKEGKGTDLAAVKRAFAARGKALWGGVSGAVTVEMGSARDTEQAVREALQVLGQGGGFILSPVDNVREDTEAARRNTRVFLDTWKKHRAVGALRGTGCDAGARRERRTS